MFKFLTYVVLCLNCFLLSSEPVYCQGDSIAVDTVQTTTDSVPEENAEARISDSLYFPVTDSLTIPGNLRQVPDSKVKEDQRNPDFAYANDAAYWKEAPPPEPGLPDGVFRFLFSAGFRTLFFILFLLVVAYAIYRLSIENSFSWFKRSSKPASADNTTGEEAEVSGVNLDEAILKYSEAGNFTVAVRYMYLKIIRTAFEKNAIQSKSSSTNADMVKAFQNPQQAKDFRYLATAYEYIFYGGFIPNQKQFDLLKQKFNSFHQTLGN